MIKRLTLTLLLVSMLLAACGPNNTPDAKSTPTDVSAPRPTLRIPKATLALPTDAPFSPATLRGVRVNLWHGLDGKTGATLSRMAAEFSQKNEWGVQVDVISQKNLSSLNEALSTVIRTPQQPDLILALPENAQGWDAQGLVADLAPYVRHSTLGLSADDIKDIPAAFWQQGQVGARQLSAPAMRSGRFLFYNVSFAKTLGFTAPPLNADDFRKQACAANASWKADDDQTNDYLGGLITEDVITDIDAPWTAYAWLKSQDGDVYTDKKYAFLTPENQKALEFLADLRNNDCIWPWHFALDTSNDEALDVHKKMLFDGALATHKALFMAGSLPDLSRQRAAFAGSTDQWTVIPFPGATPAIVVYGPDYIMLKSDTPRQWAAWLFIRWMLMPENQARWARETSLFPMRISAVGLLDNIRNANPQWAAAFDLLPQAKTYPQSPLWSKARLVLGDGFFQLFQLNPTASDVSRTLKMMDGTVDELGK
jgi:ABC-type glycerol-3-phosphate transport system substrate-binding protein